MKRFAVLEMVALFVASAFISGCQGSIAQQVIATLYQNEPKNYKSAGFNSKAEVREYASYTLYYAFQLSDQEWRLFYERFPEYWRETQRAKNLAFVDDYNPGYTAYAFRWTTLNRMKSWPQETVTRLDNKQVLPGDNVFEIVYSLGPPTRIVWDNDFELLAYKHGLVCIIEERLLSRTTTCERCCDRLSDTQYEERYRAPNPYGGHEDTFLWDNETLIKELGLKRPSE